MSKPVSNIGERIKEGLMMAGMTQQELSIKTGIPKASISQYISGYAKPKSDRIFKIASALRVSESWLLGFDVSLNSSAPNIHPISLKKFPLLGEIACGEPILANEDRESYVMAGTDIKADFCLIAKGDSMIGARILDGDIIFIQKTDIVNNGEIAAVIIDDEVLLKRFYYFREEQVLTLVSENPQYPPMNFTNEQLDHIRVLGKAVAFQSDVI